MKPRKARRHWEEFAATHPYFAVLSAEQFKGKLTQETRAEFFATGERDVSTVFTDIQEHLAHEFRPRHAMDFGCGVGRIVRALASRCDHVTGVDISAKMLEEAAANLKDFSNISFVASGDLANIATNFDFIHSYITIQHIHPQVGLKLLKRMVELLEYEGVGALHFTYAAKRSAWMRLRTFLHTSVPFAHKLINLIKGRPLNYPYTTMNQYNLNAVFQILQEGTCEHFFTRYANHHGQLGVMLYFQKRSKLKLL